jgi:hypothetical protein
MMTSSCMTLATPLFKSDRDKMDSLAKWTFRSTELTNITHWFPYFIPSQRRGSASDSDARRRRAVRAATGAMFPPQVAMWIPANARICLLDACNRKRRRHLTPRLRIILVTGLALFVRATTSVGLDNRSCLSSSCQLLIRTDPLIRIHQQSKAARDGNSGTGTGTIFYPWVAPVSDPNRDGYGTGIFSHPWVTRRVPDILLPL